MSDRFNLFGAVVFTALVLPFVLWSCFIVPPFQVADEPAHYFYAAAISRGEPVAYYGAGGDVGAVLAKYSISLAASANRIAFKPQQKFSAADRLAFANVADDGTSEFAAFPNTANYGPFVYLVPGAALMASTALQLSPAQSFYAGRVANALLYVLVGALAILLAPRSAAGPILISLLLPMSVFQAASYSDDAFVLPVSALAAALAMRQIVGDGERIWTRGIIAAVGIGIAAMAKLPLIGIALPLAVVFGRGDRKRGLALGAIAAAIPIAWYVGFAHPDADKHPGVSVLGQLHYLATNPLDVFPLALNTLSASWHPYIQEMIGVLGWLDTFLPTGSYSFFGLALLVVFALSAIGPFGGDGRRLLPRLSILAAILISGGLTFAALYLTWNPVGAPTVLGVQGRYFLPYLPWLGVALAAPAAGRFWRRTTFVIATAGALVSIPLTAWVIVMRYYLT